MVKEMFFILVFITLGFIVNGDHFLGGTITWKPLNASATGTSVAVVITQTYSWTYSLMPCTNTMIATNQFVPTYSGVSADTLDCIANCGIGSTGYTSLNVIPRCTDFSVFLDTTVGQRSDVVYLQTGDDFSVAYQDALWLPLATAAAADWSVSARINVKPRSDTGLYNNAPTANLMSPINIPVYKPTIINVPVGDADGDTLRCRWATNSSGVDECGDVCPPSSLPSGTVIYPNCTIIITGLTVGNWFAVALMVEDFINSTSATPLSSTPVQFLVQVVSTPSCSEPPSIIGQPIAGSCTLVLVGQTLAFKLIAVNKCGPSVTIKDISTLSFSGMVKGNLVTVNSTYYYKNVSWTPTTSQTGYQIMCAMAFDSQESQSAQYCFKFYVTKENLCFCPGETCTSTTTTTTTTTMSTSSTTTSITTTTASITSTSAITVSTTIVSTTSSSETKNDDVIKWALIGTLAGIPLLLGLILCSCLCWYYCCPCGFPRLRRSHRHESVESYHIESIGKQEFSSSPTRTPDEHPTSASSIQWVRKTQSTHEPVKYRTVREKPKRVTILSVPSSTSTTNWSEASAIFDFHQKNKTPYSMDEKNGMQVRRINFTPTEHSFTDD